MKLLLLLLLLSLPLIGALPNSVLEVCLQNNSELDMQLDSELVFEKMVKVYDYEGTLVREFFLNDVTNNKISTPDHIILEESDYAFDYKGDYYYFDDSEDI